MRKVGWSNHGWADLNAVCCQIKEHVKVWHGACANFKRFVCIKCISFLITVLYLTNWNYHHLKKREYWRERRFTADASMKSKQKSKRDTMVCDVCVFKSGMFLGKSEDVSRRMFSCDSMLSRPTHSEFSKPVLNPLTATNITKIFFRQPYSSFQKGETFKSTFTHARLIF